MEKEGIDFELSLEDLAIYEDFVIKTETTTTTKIIKGLEM